MLKGSEECQNNPSEGDKKGPSGRGGATQNKKKLNKILDDRSPHN